MHVHGFESVLYVIIHCVNRLNHVQISLLFMNNFNHVADRNASEACRLHV